MTGRNGNTDSRAIMRWIIAALYTMAAMAHLAVPEKLLSITPSWVPLAPQVIFLTGIFEIAGPTNVRIFVEPRF